MKKILIQDSIDELYLKINCAIAALTFKPENIIVNSNSSKSTEVYITYAFTSNISGKISGFGILSKFV